MRNIASAIFLGNEFPRYQNHIILKKNPHFKCYNSAKKLWKNYIRKGKECNLLCYKKLKNIFCIIFELWAFKQKAISAVLPYKYMYKILYFLIYLLYLIISLIYYIYKICYTDVLRLSFTEQKFHLSFAFSSFDFLPQRHLYVFRRAFTFS